MYNNGIEDTSDGGYVETCVIQAHSKKLYRTAYCHEISKADSTKNFFFEPEIEMGMFFGTRRQLKSYR